MIAENKCYKLYYHKFLVNLIEGLKNRKILHFTFFKPEQIGDFATISRYNHSFWPINIKLTILGHYQVELV
jgi:hypothetical protein